MSIKTKEILEFMMRQDNKMDVMQKQIDGMDMLLTELNPDIPNAIRKIKTLDQSVFNGEEEKWQWASFDKDGSVHKYEKEPFVSLDMDCWGNEGRTSFERIQGLEAVGRWEKSLIERESVELTGSDLTRAMFLRGDKYVMCVVSDKGDEFAIINPCATVVSRLSSYGSFHTDEYKWTYAVAIDNNGKPLTAKQVGL